MKKCPDCGGELEAGAMIDHTQGAVLAQRFGRGTVPDSPQGLFMNAHEVHFEDVRRVVAYRCQKCNRIFHYAQDRVIVSNLSQRNNQILFVIFAVTIVLIIVVLLSIPFGLGDP